jgi:clostripain
VPKSILGRRAFRALAFTLLGSLFLAATSSAVAQSDSAKRPWTILVYGAADNNADGPILEFLKKVRVAIDDDPGIELLLFIDRSDKFSRDATHLGEDFTGARLYRLRKDSAQRLSGGTQFPEITLDKEVELDSSDAANVQKFISWGKAHYPAQRTMLLIYSHADGRTMCPDEHSQRDMGIAELTVKVGVENRVDVVALELCNMAGIENAYQWRPGNGRFEADVLVAIPNAGPPLDWERAFARIRTPGHDPENGPPIDPAKMTAADFGTLVVEEGHKGRIEAEQDRSRPSEESAACLDLRVAADVKKAVDGLSVALANSDSKNLFLSLRGKAEDGAICYARDGAYPDLYELCARAARSNTIAPDVRNAATRTMETLDRFVISSFGMSAYRGFEAGKHGVFIVLPPADAKWRQFAWYTPLPGEAKNYGRWSFLADGATRGNGIVENWFELLDSWFDEASDSGGANGYQL